MEIRGNILFQSISTYFNLFHRITPILSTKNHHMKFNWGTGIFIFIILFLIVTMAGIIFSLRQNNDLVEKDYYDKGADYSHQIEINKRSAIYQDSISFTDRENYIVVKASPELCKSTASINVYFFRPSDKEKDYTIAFNTSSDSILVEKSKLAHGRYLVKLSWEKNSETYMIEKDIFIH